MKSKRTKAQTVSLSHDMWYTIYPYLPSEDLYSLCQTSKKIQSIITADLIRRDEFTFIFDDYIGNRETKKSNIRRELRSQIVSFFYQHVGSKIERITATGYIDTGGDKKAATDRKLLAKILPKLCILGNMQIIQEVLSVQAVQTELLSERRQIIVTKSFIEAGRYGHIELMELILEIPRFNLELSSLDLEAAYPRNEENFAAVFNFFRTHPYFDARQYLVLEAHCTYSAYGLKEFLADPRLDKNEVKERIVTLLAYAPKDVAEYLLMKTRLYKKKNYENLFSSAYLESCCLPLLFVLLKHNLIDIYKPEYGHKKNLVEFLCERCELDYIELLLKMRPNIILEGESSSAIMALCTTPSKRGNENKMKIASLFLAFKTQYPVDLLRQAIYLAVSFGNYAVGVPILNELARAST